MAESTLSTKNQIVIPREARTALGLKAGEKLVVIVRNDTLIIFKKPESYSEAIKGMGKGIYPEGYLDNERRSWD
jgi:AbrB family looped-hinge helix DNA binding protein